MSKRRYRQEQIPRMLKVDRKGERRSRRRHATTLTYDRCLQEYLAMA
jgi:hypothetical protein